MLPRRPSQKLKKKKSYRKSCEVEHFGMQLHVAFEFNVSAKSYQSV